MRRGRRKFKFSGKKQYPKGIASFGIGLVSDLCLFFSLRGAFLAGGKVSLYVGSLGIVATVLAVVALILGISVLKDEEAYKLFPGCGVAFGGIATLAWIGIYILGVLR